MSAPMIPIIDNAADVGLARKAWLVDVWGVIHNGVRPFRESIAACSAFRKSGGYVVLVTNAPRPSQSVVAQLDQIGVAREAYDAIVTSGDVTRGLIEAWKDRKIHHLGPERDRPLFADMNIDFVTTPEAEIVVCTGLHDDETESPEDYRLMFERFLRKRAAMLCANPDLKVERGDQIAYCAGALAKLYEEMGGDTIYAGKPHAPIYELAMGIVRSARGDDVALGDVLAVGDGVLTDIAGATSFGIDALYVGSGIHLSPDDWTPNSVAALFADAEARGSGRPIAAMPRLSWS
ncbi:MAG: TIGR01459 family HAD-type hydrolase [Pseudomonadota bacterium]